MNTKNMMMASLLVIVLMVPLNVLSNSRIENKIMIAKCIGNCLFIVSLLIRIGLINEATPKTSMELTMVEPTTLA